MRYNTRKVSKSRVIFNLDNDLVARIKSRAREENISESLFANDILRRFFMNQKDYLIWQYKNALGEVEKYRHLLANNQISSKEIVVEND